jgi:hypothetical protein
MTYYYLGPKEYVITHTEIKCIAYQRTDTIQ